MCCLFNSCVLKASDISMDTRPICWWISVASRPTYMSPDYSIPKPSMLGRHSGDTLPTLRRYSTDTRPTLRRYTSDTPPILYRHSAETLLTLGRLSAVPNFAAWKSLPRQKQGIDGLQDWLMDQLARFIADLTGDFADSVDWAAKTLRYPRFRLVYLVILSRWQLFITFSVLVQTLNCIRNDGRLSNHRKC